ncbi:MAG: hypothetical protein ACM3ZC_00130 [Bacteroidota bacterium]
MNFLYDSRGQHVASEVNGLLYTAAGRNIGRYLDKYGVFVDLEGRYLGEILCINRLVQDRNSRYRGMSLGASSSRGVLRLYERPRGCSPLPLPPGFEDIHLQDPPEIQ